MDGLVGTFLQQRRQKRPLVVGSDTQYQQ
jgi:hypothetical protein